MMKRKWTVTLIVTDKADEQGYLFNPTEIMNRIEELFLADEFLKFKIKSIELGEKP